MSVTYDKIAFPKIEESIKFILDDDFPNVYINPVFSMLGNECIRINLESSSSEDIATNFEVRTYNITVRYYTKADISKTSQNEFIKNRIDKLKKKLIDNQVNKTSNNWAKLEVEQITYNVNDDENNDDETIYIAELDVVATNFNQF
tara:strand:+ start:1251 stop:1688 length:438 start_codon:yes stop_codon:yes gene_type:complete